MWEGSPYPGVLLVTRTKIQITLKLHVIRMGQYQIQSFQRPQVLKSPGRELQSNLSPFCGGKCRGLGPTRCHFGKGRRFHDLQQKQQVQRSLKIT